MMRMLKSLFSVFALSAVMFAGDLTITMKSQVKGFMGHGSTSVETHYYSSKFMRVNNPSTQVDTLMDYATMTNYTINHKKKLIQKMRFQDMVDAMSQARPEKSGAAGAMADLKVTPEGKETVAGRVCNKYLISIGKVSMETSNDPSLKMPMPEASYAQMMKMRGSMAALSPMGKDNARLYEELAKIKGFQLKTRTSGLMGMGIEQEATAVKEGPIDPAVFALPSGYQMEDLGAKLKAEMAKHPR